MTTHATITHAACAAQATRPARSTRRAPSAGRTRRPALAPAALTALLLAFAPPAQASGPYAVDDAAIATAGSAQVETWVSLADRGHLFHLVPAVTLAALPFLEWSLAFETARIDGARESGLAVAAKAQFGAEAAKPGDLAFAASAAVRFGLDGEGATDFGLNGIVTLAATDRLLLHGNLGFGRNRLERLSALAWGARAEAALLPDRISAHAEVFGTSETSAGLQLGLRPAVAGGAVDLELVYSRNLDGEKASWATLGLSVRF